MYQERIVLSSNDILEKEFKVDTRGFRLQEVDAFLDIIIRDYVEFEKIISECATEKKALIEEITNLKAENRNLKCGADTAKATSDKEVTSVDLMRRISNIEKLIYGDKE